MTKSWWLLAGAAVLVGCASESEPTDSGGWDSGSGGSGGGGSGGSGGGGSGGGSGNSSCSKSAQCSGKVCSPRSGVCEDPWYRVYDFVINSASIPSTKSDGQPWDIGGAGKPDPYIQVTVDGQSKKTQVYQDADFYPMWFETLTFGLTENSVVEVKLMDSDLSSDDTIGVKLWVNPAYLVQSDGFSGDLVGGGSIDFSLSPQ